MTLFGKFIAYFLLVLFGLAMVIPFVWMMTTAVRSQIEFNKGNVGFIPIDNFTLYVDGDQETIISIVQTVGDSSYVHFFNELGEIERAYAKIPNDKIEERREFRIHWSNFINAWNRVPFARYFFNTILVALCTVFGILITSSLAAYAFARMRFKGNNLLFSFFISMMMVPQPIYLIPSYVLLNYLGWIDTYYALIVPWLAHIFTIFLLRQHFKAIPQELFDAAEIDGCSRFGILWRIVLPISKPILVTSSIFAFITSWNSFMWPLVMINSEELRVLQVGLSYFSQESSTLTTLLMAASTFSIMPLVILFLIAQRQIIGSYATAGLKEG
ncbi:MAG: carbohydrate ABC transporter permease [Candidatus Cloacimonetes bacterium]|nr:carbohydrate ABC transporter permease [Candidatus Cloacimonadota bacterium]